MEQADPLQREFQNLVANLRGVPEYSVRSWPRPTRQVSDIIPDLLTRWKISEQTPQEILLEHWEEVIGNPGLAQLCQPQRIDTGWKLWVAVADPVIRQELFFRRRQLLQKIQKLPGCGVIRDLYLCPG